ncbi:hypothetical protein ACKRZS_013096 [Fusarium odoratissimum]|uniref:3'-5' exonuclease domain-containing protein n=3 Tax=Fusarium oxysporum species complex TaxID=171631 RepID=N1S778_FUSC4|nr:uncharacterized protein FOIG_07544 [Fusarium odoratissimum NRRL 54006]EMT73416.1 hypothetical protein FOC4_g10004790 [Fusarium odoratissimum]EXM00562.1 hypothetical protein FOIG_07544 [Fusarium odoratissimum NRRL 54006]KAK2127487.1 hypothetical protein NOF04DRAFT_3561 [Fusarium oxysporum II5]TXB98835.1 hypothetical protein FocTR4_00013393 [Fusarium oxysporum f. sp. cubense]
MESREEPDMIPIYEDEPRIIWVGDRETLYDVLDDLDDIPKFKPRLFITLEGNYVGHDTRISIMQIYNAVSHRLYLIDVYWLGATTFWAFNRFKTFLKGILESEDIIKVFFDAKKYSEALYSQYKIKLAGVHDLQLMELATSENPYKLSDIDGCFSRDAPRLSGNGGLLWDLRGAAPSWSSHRIRARYVQIFPELYACYDAKLRAQPAQRENMISASKAIVALSQTTICATEEWHQALMRRDAD